MTRRTWIAGGAVGAALLAGIVVVVVRDINRMDLLSGDVVVVTVTNESSAPVRGVWVETTGGRWPVGILEPSAEATVHATVVGESSVFVGWTTPAGDAVAWDADVYFDTNLGGAVDATIEDGDRLGTSGPRPGPRRIDPPPVPRAPR